MTNTPNNPDSTLETTGIAVLETAVPAVLDQELVEKISSNQLCPYVASREDLNGAFGRFRNHSHIKMSDSKNDIQAISEWANDRGKRSPETYRSYRKEAERLLAWATLELGKPLSSLTNVDLLEYEKFLANPVSRHADYSWISPQSINEKSLKVENRRYKRKHADYRPFLKGLSPSSVHLAMITLKGMYGYWLGAGYVLINPLKLRKASFKPNKKQVLNRSLSIPEWNFLFKFIQGMEDSIPDSLAGKERLAQLRLANQFCMVFSCLYLLGARISELAAIKMSDFELRYGADGTQQYWLTIVGKGGESRDIPVANDLIAMNKKYRQFLNTFTTTRKKGNTELPITPSQSDNTNLVLSMTGTKGLTASGIHAIVKKVVALAVEELKVRSANMVDDGIDGAHLKKTSAHWFRHTTATHKSLSGVGLRHIKEFLGHKSFDTTTIYDHVDNDRMYNDIQISKLIKD